MNIPIYFQIWKIFWKVDCWLYKCESNFKSWQVNNSEIPYDVQLILDIFHTGPTVKININRKMHVNIFHFMLVVLSFIIKLIIYFSDIHDYYSANPNDKNITVQYVQFISLYNGSFIEYFKIESYLSHSLFKVSTDCIFLLFLINTSFYKLFIIIFTYHVHQTKQSIHYDHT